MNYTSNLHLPIIPSNQYSTTRVADMIAANQGDSESSAFNIIDTAIAGKQNQITINPTGETATATIISMKIDGVVYQVAGEVINIDSELSTTSTNPVQNKVVKQALDAKQGKLTPGNGITIDDNNVISGSSQITVDEQLSDTSDNPVTSKAIKAALDQKANSADINPVSVTFSTVRSEDSKALEIKSFTVNESGDVTIYNVPDAPLITVDTEISADSENPVQNKVIKAALDAKQNTLVAGNNITIVDNVISATATATGDVDDALSATSTNPVQNKVIYQALQNVPSTTSVQNMIDSAIQGALNNNY